MSLSVRHIDRTSVRVTAAGATVTIEGVLREPNASAWLMPFIDAVHAEARESGLREVVLDLRRLRYANAGLWKCLVLWIRLMCGDARAKYRLRIVRSPAQTWQALPMASLATLGGDRLNASGPMSIPSAWPQTERTSRKPTRGERSNEE